MIRSLISMGLIRVVPALGLLVFNLLAAKLLNTADASSVFLSLSFLYLVLFLSKFGLDIFVLKYYSTKKNNGSIYFLYVALIESITIAFILCGLLSVALYFYGYVGGVFYFICSLPFITGISLIGAYYRGIGKINVSSFLEIGVVTLISIPILMATHMLLGTVSEIDFGISYFFVSIVIFMLMLANVINYRQIKKVSRGLNYKIGIAPLIFKSWKYSLISILIYLTQWTPIFFMALISAKGVVVLTLINRISSILSFALATVDSFFAPQIARAFRFRQYSSIEQLLKKNRIFFIWVSLLALPASGLILFYFMDYFFADEYTEVKYLCVVQILGYCLKLIIGPAGAAMQMMSKELSVLRINALVVIFMSLSCFMMIMFVKDERFLIAIFIVITATFPVVGDWLLMNKCRQLINKLSGNL